MNKHANIFKIGNKAILLFLQTAGEHVADIDLVEGAANKTKKNLIVGFIYASKI